MASFPNGYMNLALHQTGRKAIADSIERHQIDIVHFEHFWVTGYVFQMGAHVKKVIVYQDLHHTIYQQLARLENRFHRKLVLLVEAAKFYTFERLLDKRADLKIFLNPIEMLSFPNRSVHIPHIVNADIRFKPARETDSFNILFLGAYNHPPNRRSVEFIVQNILPRLAELQHPFNIHVVGPDTEKFAPLVNGSPYREQVVIHGFKKDINEAFREMDIALFPILDGGGIKTKLIDALAAGVPVVTTPKGVEGLEGLPEDVIGIGTTPDELVREIDCLMRSYPLRFNRSQSGRAFIDRHHSYSAFSHQVTQVYAGL
jgi:glycosyltransferase involved in cell wall biosynthesis